jgi:tetratricopeptide (TPR) repeat protein
MRIFLHNPDPLDELEAVKARTRRARKIQTLGITALIALISGIIGYWLISPRISNWLQFKDLESARRYEEQRDYRRALLTLEQAVQIYPQNIEAKRRLADFYERTGQRQTLALWSEIVRLEPANLDNLTGLAGAALRFGEWDTCRKTLEQLRQTGKTGTDYYRIAAGLSMGTRDDAALEENLAALSRLNPADLRVQLNLAIVRLRPADRPGAEAARASLLQLARTDSMRIRAVVELLDDVARRWPEPAAGRVVALEHLARLLTPAVGPRLDITRDNDPIERLIDFAMGQPVVAPEDAVALINWMMLNSRPAAALVWADRLPAKTGDSIMVMKVVADAALRAQDWSRLRKLLQAGVWGDVPPGAVTRALAAHERHRLNQPANDRSNWAAAIEASRSSLSGLQVLLRLSEVWNRPEDCRQVLVAITNAFPRESWAWRQLISYALSRHDSEQLWQVYQHWSRAQAGDTSVQTETAIIGLLLQQRNAPAPRVTAEYLRLQPNSPGAVVAHALALWRAKRAAEALPLLDALPRRAFDEPRFALAYGLLLSEVGRAQDSEQMLGRASAERLLPDERLLVEQARARNQPRLAVPRN